MTELKYKAVIELLPAAPFNFDANFHKPDHFPSADNLWHPGIRWQTLRWKNMPLGLKFENRGTIDQPSISLSVWSAQPLDSAFLHQLTAEIEYRAQLHFDLGNFYRRFKEEPHLGPLLVKWRGLRPMNFNSLYEYLMIAIVLQNATVRWSVNMLQALFENYGSPLSYDGKELYCFWEPQALTAASEKQLRVLKVGYRAKSILRVTESILNQDIDELDLRERSVEDQQQALLRLYGVGPASVGYILFDVFHQLDVMDHISPWEQKIYSRLFFEADPEHPLPVDQLLEYFDQRFPGYRMLAVHYFWEDLFWRRKTEPVAWLEKLIRL
jgi:3-methyladenine DNA glycosylase/8-oxoguanine DNA glycosylase